VYYKLFVILYADDTVILSESKDEQVIEIVHTYSYLGVIFKYNGTFLETKKKLAEQAEKALIGNLPSSPRTIKLGVVFLT
jgi:hypothetical protein